MDMEAVNALSSSALKSTRAVRMLVFSAVLFAFSAGVFFLFDMAVPGLLQCFASGVQLTAALTLHWKTKHLRSYVDATAARSQAERAW